MHNGRSLIWNTRAACALGLLPLIEFLSGCSGPGRTRPPTGRIAFTDGRVGNAEIWVMNADGTDQTNLTDDPAWDERPAWSPDGRKIAFLSDRDAVWQIYVMNADGSEQRRLIREALSTSEPCWSPDGEQIAFSSRGRIRVVDADGGGPATPLAQGHAPAWSPDGAKIAFHRYDDGSWDSEVWVMNADGTDQTALTSTAGRDGYPAWSPDGRKIAFTSWWHRGICIMNADGTGQTPLLGDPYGPLAWCPDGRQIAFVADLEPYDPYHLGLYVVNADGTGRRLLADNVAYDHMGGDERGVWSPNGHYIAYTSYPRAKGEPGGVGVVNVHSGKQPAPGLPGAHPAWCPVP